MRAQKQATRITYLYRDADNYKSYAEVIVSGPLTFAEIGPYLDSGQYFIASQVGLPDPQAELDSLTCADHVFVELEERDLIPTDEEPTVEITAGDLVTKFQEAHRRGWDVTAAMCRLGLAHSY